MRQLFTALLFLLFTVDAMAAPPATWGKLTKGPHQVGFVTRVEFDVTRSYGPPYQCAASCQTQPRPIVLAVWYPASTQPDAATMRYEDYLDVTDPNVAVRPFAARLSLHSREEVIRYALEQAPEVPLSAPVKQQLLRLLAMPMAAVRGAPQRPGRFPLVIYHSGLGGTIEENATLAEYLASYGYVVVSSAFQADDSTTMFIDWDLERSKRDMTFILRSMLGWSQVDGTRIAVMGQSYGAQAALAFALISRNVSAVVSIDSTIENAPPDHEFVRSERFIYNLDRANDLQVPLLAFATNDQGWWFLDKFKYSDRYYIALDGIDHAGSTSQGLLGSQVVPAVGKAPPSGTPSARLQYDRLCESIRGFLDAKLLTSPGARFEPVDVPGVHVHHKAALPLPPRGHQLAELLLSEGLTRASARCVELRRADQNACAGNTMHEAADYLEAQGRREEALNLLSETVRQFPKDAELWDALGCALLRKGVQDKAIAAFQQGLAQAQPPYLKSLLKKRLMSLGVQPPTDPPPAKPR